MNNKNGDQKIVFSNDFTPRVNEYIEANKKINRPVSVKEFANSIGVDQHAVWAWATKKKKNESGELTDELARPKFHEALTTLDQLEKQPDRNKLTPQQELFCQYYATDREFFGNGVQSYIEAYGIDVSKKGQYTVARSGAYENLTKPHILKRINELLDFSGLNDVAVDKELMFVIQQSADMPSKVAAIREYNKLKSRVTDRMDLTTKGKELPAPIYNGKSGETV